jgi:hypothetical protein
MDQRVLVALAEMGPRAQAALPTVRELLEGELLTGEKRWPVRDLARTAIGQIEPSAAPKQSPMSRAEGEG